MELVFHGDPIATTGQVFIMLTQNITTNTFGVIQASSGKSSYRQAIRNVMIMPSIYVLAVVIIVKISGFTVPEQIIIPLNTFQMDLSGWQSSGNLYYQY